MKSRRTLSSNLRKFELLENRTLLTTTSFAAIQHNARMAPDVTGDALVSPLDALVVLNALDAQAKSQSFDDSHFALDVNADGNVSPIDALIVLNQLEANLQMAEAEDGDIVLPIGDGTDIVYNQLTGELRVTSVAPLVFLQIANANDTFLSQNAQNLEGPADVIDAGRLDKKSVDGFTDVSFGTILPTGLSAEEINASLVIDGRTEEAIVSNRLGRIELSFVDEQGAGVTNSIEVGDTIYLTAMLHDLRPGPVSQEEIGFFAAYFDVTYDNQIATPVAPPEFLFTDFYSPSNCGSFGDGLFDEVGAFTNSLSPLGDRQVELFRIAMQANSPGELTFNTDPADIKPAHDILLYGIDRPIDAAEIDYGSATITVTGEVQDPIDLVAFAQQLTDHGVVLYGAAWDRWSTEQKELFQDGGSFLPFVEVTQPDRTLNQVGEDENIVAYPTWSFPSGDRVEGLLSLERIAELAEITPIRSRTPFIAPLDDVTLLAGSPLLLPLDGYDPDNSELTYTFEIADPSVLSIETTPENPSWRLDVAGYGDLVFELLADRVPRVADRFIELTETDFFSDIIFHRVINEFVIQGGDPTGTGSGGSTLGDFDDQFHVDLQHNRTGLLSMAKAGDDTNDSQFFITEGAARHLDFNHSIFGILVEGEANRDAISNTAVNTADRPVNDVIIESATIFQDLENASILLKAAEGTTGSTSITVTATDTDGNSAQRTFQVSVQPDTVNAAPFLADIPELDVLPNTPFQYQLTAIDAEGDDVFFSGQAIDEFDFAVNSATGVITMTPPTDFTGELEAIVRVRAADGGPTSPFDSQRILFRVQAAATPVPTIALAAASDSGISETDQLTNAADLQLLVSNLVVGSTVQVILQGDIIDTFVATSETMAVPTGDISDLPDGSYLIIAWQALDGIPSDLSTTLEVTIDRTAPTALTDDVPTSVTTGELLEIDLAHPEESDSFRYFLGNPPVGMSIELQTGLIRWRPNSTQLGPHTFQVRTADAAGNETSQDYTIHVVQPDFLADYDLISIATQLAESGAVLWGTPWDTVTLAQRELFQDAARFLPLQNAMDGHRSWTADAQAAEITQLPTWILADGSRLEGVQSIRDIATAAGITLTESNEPWFAEINDITLSSGSPKHIAIDAFDPNSDALRFEVSVDNPDVSASVLAGNRSLQLNLAGYGSMTFQLFEQRVPLITAQIASLVEADHYDGLEIFKINSQLIQTGDVRDLGMGHNDVGPVDDQFHPDLQHNQPGVLSMAKLIDDANDAQFFITNAAQRHYDFHNSIFGQLTDGDDIRQSVVAATTHVGGFSQYGMEITSAQIMNDQENGLLLLSAPEGYQGTANVTVTAFDSNGNSFSRSFPVQIQPDEYNSGPYLIDTPESITVPQSGGALTLNSFDVEGDAVRYSARTTSDVAMDVTVNAVSGRIEVHPPAGFVGTFMLEVAVHPVGISDTADRYDRQQILVNVTAETIANDLNLDGRVDYLDIAAACHEINRGNMEFDLNNDGRLDRYDIAEFTEIAFQTGPGDADLNGTFATTDLINMMKAGEYEDSLNGNSSWLTGDFNCDGEFDSTDLIFAFQLGRFVEEA